MEVSSPWDINIRVIEAQYPGLAEQLREAADEDCRIEPSVAGPPVLIVQDIHIHSPRDPVREGHRLAESLAGEGPVVILGFGLGYAAEALADTTANAKADASANAVANAAAERGRPLIIVERRPGLLKKALETRDLSRFLSENRLIFVLGEPPEEGGLGATPPDNRQPPPKTPSGGGAVITALELLRTARPGGRQSPAKAPAEALAILRNRALMGLDKDWYAGVERHIQTWTSRDEVNLATLRRFGKRWVRNLASNLEAIRDLPGVARLGGLLAGEPIPALLAAAGPSLDAIGPFLPEIARRCLIVGVDTSLRFLLDAGVDPDFVLSVDPQYWNGRHLDHAPAPRSCLVAESAVYPPVLRHPFRRVFLCGSLFPLGRFVEDRVDPKGDLGAGGSVATTAWDFVRLLGARTIFIAGLDLGFPGLKTHFKGARFEEKALAESGRLDPAETRSVRVLRDGQPFRAPGAGGTEVLTDRRLSLYAAWFESRFRQFPQIRNRRLGTEGLAIPGLESVGMEELRGLPPRREEITARLEAVFTALDKDFSLPEAADERGRRYRAAREDLIRGMETIRAAAVRAAERAAIGRNRKLRAGEGERLLGELDAVTRSIMESPVKDAAGFLFPPATDLEACLETPVSKPLERHLEFSEKLFRALAEAAAYPLGLIRK